MKWFIKKKSSITNSVAVKHGSMAHLLNNNHVSLSHCLLWVDDGVCRVLRSFFFNLLKHFYVLVFKRIFIFHIKLLSMIISLVSEIFGE